jgi:pimeloyl-ACP methyl ester carboxylesterase
MEAHGARLYYETAGRADAPPVLLLHGGMGSIEDFTPLLPTLASNLHLIALDSRGHGRSTLGSRVLTYQQLEEDALALLEHLQLKAATVIGFSDGGIAGYRMIASHPAMVTRLVTIGAHFELRADDPVRAIFAAVTGESWRNKFPATYDLYQRLNPEPDFDRLVAAAVHMWMDTSASGYPAETVDRIRGKVMVMRGDADHLFARRDAALLADRIPGAAFANIPFAGHAAHEDQAAPVAQIIQQFLGQGEPGAAT